MVVFTVGAVLAGPAQGQVCAQEFALAQGSEPAGITTGSDGNVWFTEAVANKIGRITPWGAITEFPLEPQHGSSPVGITRGPDGALWFTIESGRIGRITTSGQITSYTIDPGQPHGIVTGPDGALWFTYFNRPALGRITTGGVASLHPLPLAVEHPVQAHSITVGPDGALWFTEFLGDRIARYVPGNPPQFAEFELTPGSRPHGIITGPDGAIWFAEQGRHRIGRMSVAGQLLEEIWTGRNSGPHELAVDQYGQVWFTEIEANRVSRMDPVTKAIERFCIPTPNSAPGYIVAGPDGAMWFHERYGHKIGRILLPDDTTH